MSLNLHTALARSNALVAQPGTLTFQFEELPLIISDDGFELAPVSGAAEIEYTGYYEFEVRVIYLDGARAKTPAEWTPEPSGCFVYQQIKLDQREHNAMWCAIAEQLDRGSFKRAVESAIFREIEKDAA